MPKCIVPGCTSGYDSNHDKFHFFTVPNDPEAVELWAKAVKRKDVKPRQAVCENHFKTEETVWQRPLLGADGSVLGVSYYKKPHLVKGTVPSIFPWAEETETTEAIPQLQIRIDAGHQHQLEIPQNVNLDAEINLSPFPLIRQKGLNENKENASPPSKSLLQLQDQHLPDIQENDRSADDSIVKVEEISSVLLTFEQLSAAEINLLPGWLIQKTVCGITNLMILCTHKCVNIDGAYEPFILKAVTVKDDLSINISVLGKRVDMQKWNFPCFITDITQLEELLRTLDRMNVCRGCPGSSVDTQMTNVNYRKVHKDSTGIWRHQECSLLLSSGRTCDFCRNTQKMPIMKLRQWKTGEVKKKQYNATNSPTLRRKIIRLRDNLHATKISKVKLVEKYKTLKAELKISEMRMTRCTNLEEQLKSS